MQRKNMTSQARSAAMLSCRTLLKAYKAILHVCIAVLQCTSAVMEVDRIVPQTSGGAVLICQIAKETPKLARALSSISRSLLRAGAVAFKLFSDRCQDSFEDQPIRVAVRRAAPGHLCRFGGGCEGVVQPTE